MAVDSSTFFGFRGAALERRPRACCKALQAIGSLSPAEQSESLVVIHQEAIAAIEAIRALTADERAALIIDPLVFPSLEAMRTEPIRLLAQIKGAVDALPSEHRAAVVAQMRDAMSGLATRQRRGEVPRDEARERAGPSRASLTLPEGSFARLVDRQAVMVFPDGKRVLFYNGWSVVDLSDPYAVKAKIMGPREFVALQLDSAGAWALGRKFRAEEKPLWLAADARHPPTEPPPIPSLDQLSFSGRSEYLRSYALTPDRKGFVADTSLSRLTYFPSVVDVKNAEPLAQNRLYHITADKQLILGASGPNGTAGAYWIHTPGQGPRKIPSLPFEYTDRIAFFPGKTPGKVSVLTHRWQQHASPDQMFLLELDVASGQLTEENRYQVKRSTVLDAVLPLDGQPVWLKVANSESSFDVDLFSKEKAARVATGHWSRPFRGIAASPDGRKIVVAFAQEDGTARYDSFDLADWLRTGRAQPMP